MNDTSAPNHEHYGDPLDEHPPPDITRFYIQNVNGLCWDQDGGRWPYICDTLSSIGVDIACFSELNTNTNKYHIRSHMEKICQRQFEHSRLIMSSSTHKTTRDYKPGGTSILACNDITLQIKSHSRDRMGRWTSLSLTTSHRPIRIISAYQVCQSSTKGTTTAAAQQQSSLIMEQRSQNVPSRIDPRRAFIADLQAFILQLQEANEDIILVGDFNEEMSEPNSGIGTLAARCGLADVFAIRLGSSSIPATYQRGKKRLDYALISPVLLPHIRAAGYDPFAYRIPSDHRGMYIDFDTNAVFQQNIPPLAPASRRGFSSKTPGVVNQYVTAKMQYLQDHNFFDRLRNLMTHELPNHDLAESLDRDFQRASLHAARQCTRKRRTPWSPHLASIWATLHYYRLAKSALTTQADLLPAIQRLQNTWPHLPSNITTDRQEIQQGYIDAIRRLKLARQKAQELREDYLAQKVALYNATDEPSKAKALQRLLRAETQHQIFKKIQSIRNNDEGTSGLNYIRVPKRVPVIDSENIKKLPDSDEHWETVTAPSRIEEILLQRNRHHFGQAKDTPFAKPPLAMEVGYKADGCTVNMILKGNARYPNLPHAAQLLIQHLQQKSTIAMDGTITPKQILGKLKKWREETTTSPSGLHLGHYHCMWRSPLRVDGDGDAYDRIISGQAQLLQALTDLLNYAIKHGYAYTRWKKIVNVMLQKDIGNPRIHRLRIIHIYEADYNLLLAVKWRQALHHAESHKLLNDGLYGSRKGRSAHDPVLMEVLQNETYRMSMKPGINFDLDATSCYDRILMNVASISSRRMGMNQSTVLVNAQTLEQAHYHLKTNLGVSEGFYTHSNTQPIHGTGQGSGNSPTVWCFVCSALFDAFESRAHGASFGSYDTTVNTKIYMTGYVDDCTQRVNDFHNPHQPDTNVLIHRMTEDAQLWNDLLWASGGALEQSKCSFHLIQSDWNHDGHPFLKGGHYSPPIPLVDGQMTTLIQQKSNYEAHKSLGCYINPAHSQISSLRSIIAKNTKLAQLIEMNYFTKSEAWIFYTSFYLPSITYSLPMTPLTLQQCTDLNTRVLQVLLPKCGYNRNMSSAIRYAPVQFGGAGFRHLYTEQGALQLQQIIKYLNSPTTTIGKLLRISISWTQAFLGTSQPFLTATNQKFPPIGNSWLMDLRAFLISINASIHLTDFPISRTLRTNDRFIMDIAVNQQKWTNRQLIQINSCRRFLQAQTLADICNLSGTRLLGHVKSGQGLPPTHTVRIAMFNQPRPNDKAWQTWKKFLEGLSNKQGLLYQPLGPWVVRCDKLRHWPQFVYDSTAHRMYSHYQGALYYPHEPIDSHYFRIIPMTTPTHAVGYPTAVTSIMDRLRPIQNSNPHPLPHLTFIAATRTYHQRWEAELLAGVRNLVTFAEIQRQVHDGNLILCSDGSATEHTASFGFVVATQQGKRLVCGNGPAPGSYPNSFRSEAYGLLSTVLWLQQILRHLPPLRRPIPKVIHYMDNQSVISRVDSLRKSKYASPNDHLKPEHDVIQEIVVILSNLPWYVDVQWVKGHQDNDCPVAQLPLPAQLNCAADREAASHTAALLSQVTPLPHSPCQVTIHDNSVTSHYRHRVRVAAAIPPLHKYLTVRFKWNPNTVQLIDWSSHSEIIKKYRDQRTTIVKHLFDISPTGKIAHRNDHTLPHQCPACNEPYEDNIHVIRCGATSRQNWRQSTLELLQRQDKPGQDPILMDILQDGIRRFFSSTVPPNDSQYPPRYTQLLQEQADIGWDQLFKARWSTQWNQLQNDYIQRKQSTTKVGPRHSWTTSIGRKLLDKWLELWAVRNVERHGKDAEHQQAIRVQHITAQLGELYSYKNKVCPSDVSLFYADVTEHLQKHTSLSQVEDWISMHCETIRASVALATKLGIHQNRAITEYPTFNPAIQAGRQASLTAGLPTG
jgi:exonuclease III